MFKVLNDKNPQIRNEIFRIRDEASYELRQRTFFLTPSVNSFFSGTESIQLVRKSVNFYQVISNVLKI